MARIKSEPTPQPAPALRNLDLAILRSFITAVESGSMTRAANRLHLTQSAISMQIKRLEESLGFAVFDRAGRSIQPTPSGDLLAHYARQLLALNDEAWGRLTASEYSGQVSLGVPTDIIHPTIPRVLREFAADYPRVQINLHASLTRQLLKDYRRGTHDLILTTEPEPGRDGVVLSSQALIWTGAVNGVAWKKRPLPISFSTDCAFRHQVIASLEAAGTQWVDVLTTNDLFAGFVTVSADLGIAAELEHSDHQDRIKIDHGGQLPELPEQSIVLYSAASNNDTPAAVLADYLRRAYQ